MNRLTAAAAAANQIRTQKVYSMNGPLVGRAGSTKRTILRLIAQRNGRATALAIRKAMKRNTPDATVRYYLGKLQHDGVITSATF